MKLCLSFKHYQPIINTKATHNGAQLIMNHKTKALKGYKGRDPISHRKSSRVKQAKRFKAGKMTYRGKGALRGSGHRAGENWAARKEINPSSGIKKYSKNSPSFDEGVAKYKQSAKSKALSKSK